MFWKYTILESTFIYVSPPIKPLAVAGVAHESAVSFLELHMTPLSALYNFLPLNI